MKSKIIIPLAAVLLLSACNASDSDKVLKENMVKGEEIHTKEETNKQINKTNESQEKDELVDFGTRFIAPEFMVKKFNIKILDNNKMNFEVTYEISEKLYKFLLKKPTYYFGIEFPQKTIDTINLDKSSYLEGPEVMGGKMTYTISFTEQLTVSLSQTDIEKLETNKNEYKLYVFNKNKYPVYINDDIEISSQLVPGKSDFK